MGSLIQFVQNYQDLSTDRGFQFKFFCDKCGNGYMTRFHPSTLGMAESALHVAANLFGGVFNTIGNSAYEVQRAIGGSAHDAALEAAVEECKQQFHQCTRCGKWVCPEVCWNGAASLCEGCAPNFQEEMAAQQARMKAEALREQLYEKARKEDYVGKIDMSAGGVQRAPGPVTAAENRCASCGTALGPDVKFCPQCGSPRTAPGCPGCGAPIAANTKFCAQCGGKLV
jgi:hypothetical protein